MKKIANWRKILKPILFCFLLLGLVLVIQSRAFKISDVRSYQTFEGYYSEPKGSLDMVYIGQSNVYPFWTGLLAWENHGMTSYPLAIGAMPARAVKYIVEEGLKTQPNAVYLINLNSFTDINFNTSHLHNVTDYMKLSGTKIRLIRDLKPFIQDEYEELEFYMPIIRFHPGWNELTETSFEYGYNGLKGGSYYSNFLETIMDVSSTYRTTANRVELSKDQSDVLNDLMDYMDSMKVKALFVTVPQSIADESIVGQLNSAKDLAESRGYDVLDLESSLDEIGLDPKTDYYNEQHLNLHGSIKFTEYLAQYLIDKYGFEDKRGDSTYKDWDEALVKYHDIIDGYALDFEYSVNDRDFDIEAPEITSLVATGQSFYIGWEYKGGRKVDGFSIYRKYIGNESTESIDPASKWEKITDVDSEAKSYQDSGLELFGEYQYRVAPYVESNAAKSGRIYGEFSYTGAQGVTRIDPPEITGFEHTDEGNVITWAPIEGVDGYAIVRKLDGQTFVNIGEVDKDTLTYTDSFYQDGVKYTYSVAGYMSFGEGIENRKYGYYDQNGPEYGGE